MSEGVNAKEGYCEVTMAFNQILHKCSGQSIGLIISLYFAAS